MKTIKHCFIFVMLLITSTINTNATNNTDKTSLSGKITSKNGETLFGVTVYIPDLKTGAITDVNGNYTINNLPKAKILIKVSLLGFKTIIYTVDLSTTTTKDFVMEESVREMNEVVITGTSKATEIKRDPVPIIVINKAHLVENSSTNIIDAIATMPGVNAVTTGPNVSKPYIRGLGFNRVLSLYDGVRQEGSQWGDEHGIEADEYSIDKIEIVKGPASLTYGSDALAGVVNLLPAPPVPEGSIQGEVQGNYQSNNNMLGRSASFAGNENGFVWGGRFSHKMAVDYKEPIDGRVYGTAFNENDANGYIGFNKQWGYSHLRFSVFDDLQEIPDGSRDSATMKFTKQITEDDTIRPVVSDDELNSYSISVLHQHVQHYRIISASNFGIGKGNLGVTLGYQQSIRREFSHPGYPELAGLYISLNSYTYDFKYSLPESNGWETTIGVNGMYQTNTNNGTEFLIPNYHSFDFGPFAYTKKTAGKLDVAAGVRFDSRSFTNDGMFTAPNPVTGFDMQVNSGNVAGASQPFTNYQHTFSGLSGSIGATYNFTDNFLLKGNVSRGFRNPNIAEISANGVHPGTAIYQIGSESLKPEFSLQEDIGIAFSTQHVSGSLELFNNDITDYIYNQKILSMDGTDSTDGNGNTFFHFEATHAQLYGGEVDIDIHPHPLDWLHFENSLSLLYGVNKGVSGITVTDQEKYLPFTPPAHIHSELRANINSEKKSTLISGLYVKVGMDWYAKQDRAYLAYNTETPTPGYTLFGAGIGGNIMNKSGRTLFSIHILGSNITDLAYQAHLSRLKYFYSTTPSGYNVPAPNGSLGIYNMGRNISLKLIVPIG